MVPSPTPPSSSSVPFRRPSSSSGGGGAVPTGTPPTNMDPYKRLPLSWCNFSPSQRHEYRPHPRLLYRASCMYCGISNDCQRAREHPTYLRYRRRFKQDAGLLSIGVPLHESSRQTLKIVADMCGICMTPSESVPMLTLVEGLVPEEAEALYPGWLQELQRALALDATLAVRKVHKVRQKDDAHDLILLNVDVSLPVWESVSRLADTQQCVLPQFSLHVTLGSIIRKYKQSADAVKKVRNYLSSDMGSLCVDWQGVKLLSSSNGDAAGLAKKMPAAETNGVVPKAQASLEMPQLQQQGPMRQVPLRTVSLSPHPPASPSPSIVSSDSGGDDEYEHIVEKPSFHNTFLVAPFCEEVSSHATTAPTEDCSLTVGTMEDEGLEYDLWTTPLAIDLSFLEINA